MFNAHSGESYDAGFTRIGASAIVAGLLLLSLLVWAAENGAFAEFLSGLVSFGHLLGQ
jgi:hypothetical protein